MNTIFDITGDRFFVPLASRNRKIYIDMYEYIQKFTTYCINNKNMLDIYNTDKFIQIFSKDRYYDKFFKANKDTCIEVARTYFEYHDTFIE